jgi:hypothetical protein
VQPGDANVISVVELPSANGQPRAVIYTHTMPKLAPDRLQKCNGRAAGGAAEQVMGSPPWSASTWAAS